MSSHEGELDRLRQDARGRRNLRPIILGQSISLFGDYIAYFTLPYFVAVTTGLGRDVALISFSETVPMIIFGLVAGVVIDRTRILRALIFSDLARAAAFLLLAIAVFSGTPSILMVLGVAFIVGSMSVVFDSGLQAILPRALPDDLLVTANSRLALARTIGFVLGPAIGGLLVATARGFEVAFLVQALTFLASAVYLTMVRPFSDAPAAPRDGESIRRSIAAGLRFLWSDGRLRWATIGAALTNLVFAPLEALLVLFVDQRLTETVSVPAFLEWAFRDGAEVGMFIALQAAIGSVGIAVAPRIARRLPLGRMFAIGLAMLGGGFFIVGLSTSYWAVIPSGVALAGTGWVNVALFTLRQRIAPPQLLGRVVSASRTFAFAGLPLGSIIGGFAADAVGLVPVYVTGSILVVVVALILTTTDLWRDRTTAESDGGPERHGAGPDEARLGISSTDATTTEANAAEDGPGSEPGSIRPG